MLSGFKKMFTKKQTARDRFSQTPAQFRERLREAEKAAKKIREGERQRKRQTVRDRRRQAATKKRTAERVGLERRTARRVEVEEAALKHPNRMVHCTVCNNFTHADYFCKKCGAHPAGSGRKRRRKRSSRRSSSRSSSRSRSMSRMKSYKGSMDRRPTRKLRR